jgi:hypothetical protein
MVIEFDVLYWKVTLFFWFWSGSIKYKNIYFFKKIILEILEKFWMKITFQVSILTQFGLKLNKNQDRKKDWWHTLQAKYREFDVFDNNKDIYNVFNKSC